MATVRGTDALTREPPLQAVDLLPGESMRPAWPPTRPSRVVETVGVALRVLEGEGPGALTMRRLAEEQGIQAPSLYKHFSGKGEVESALIEHALFDIGEVTHRALHDADGRDRLASLLEVYRRHSLSHANLYRLATAGPLVRDRLPDGLEEWAGNPWFVVTGDPLVAQALWSFAHGMVILELDDRYPPSSDLDGTWRAGAAAFEQVAAPNVADRRPGCPAGP
jgi:AcrR family transcriptional regulator